MTSAAANSASQTEPNAIYPFEFQSLTQRRSGLSSPEPDVQRGRKRRRELGPLAGVLSGQIPSGGSCNLRGRRRHRSTSLGPLASLSRNGSRSTHHHHKSAEDRDAKMNLDGFHKAGDRSSRANSFLREVLRLDSRRRRRSQSPSRSRSPARRLAAGLAGSKKMEASPARRRQRTRSRSRKHGDGGLRHVLGSGSPPLLFEMVAEGGSGGKRREEEG